MTVELVLLLSLYVFILLGGFIGEDGILNTYRNSTPRFSAKLEKHIAIGWRFGNNSNNHWSEE